MNRFLPLLATDSHTLDTYIWGGGRGSDIRSMSSSRPICKCWCPPLVAAHQPPELVGRFILCVSVHTNRCNSSDNYLLCIHCRQPNTTLPNLLNDLSSVCLMLPAAHHLSDDLSSVYLMTPAAHQTPELVKRFILYVSDAASRTPSAWTCQTIYPLGIWWHQLHTNRRNLSDDLSSVYPMPPAAHQPPELGRHDAESRKLSFFFHCV